MKKKTTYEVLDLETGNMQGVFGSLLEALRFVQDSVEQLGQETVKDLALYESGPDGKIKPIAQDQELLPLIGIHSEAPAD